MPSQPSSGGKKSNVMLPMVIAALFVFAVIGFYLYQQNSQTQVNPAAITENQTPVETSAPVAEYKDGTYSATGNYVSPGGPRAVDVSITVTEGKITDATFAGKAEDGPTKRFQGEFADNYKQLVIGKDIDEVNLTKVSGSSLTPKGFNDALEKIKTEAKG